MPASSFLMMIKVFLSSFSSSSHLLSSACKENSLTDFQSLDAINIKESSKSLAPDIIELGCTSLVTNHGKNLVNAIDDHF